MLNPKYFLEENFVGIADLNYKNIAEFVASCADKHGILIADYDMPDIDGIELLNNYADTNLIKILLTSAYSYKKATQALNKKLIDYYLAKNDLTKLPEAISEQQRIFFSKISKNVMSFLDTSGLNFLVDKAYLHIFNNTCQQYNIEKYYILNSYGHYYLENLHAKWVFSIYNSNDLASIAQEVAEDNRYDVECGNLIPSHFSLNKEYTLINAEKYGNYSYCVERVD